MPIRYRVLLLASSAQKASAEAALQQALATSEPVLVGEYRDAQAETVWTACHSAAELNWLLPPLLVAGLKWISWEISTGEILEDHVGVGPAPVSDAPMLLQRLGLERVPDATGIVA